MIRLATLGIRIVLAAVFIYAGFVKASASEEFALALLPFTFVPDPWTGPLAITLATTEIIAGALLLIPRLYVAGALAVLALSLLFIGVLTWALANGIIVDCNCFGKDDTPSAGKMLLAIGRDVLIVIGAAAVLAGARRRA